MINLKTAMIFGTGMILQREKPIPVWGTAQRGACVTVSLGNDRTTVMANADGSWLAVLPARPASEKLHMCITDGKETIHYDNVSVGEVWLAGGQSNMEFPLGFDADCEEALDGYSNNLIRFFSYPQVSYEGELDELNFDQYGFWRTASKASSLYISSVGYFFAQKLYEFLKIPVGIIACNWGGSTASCWMDRNYLSDTEGDIWLEEYDREVVGLDVERYIKEFKENPFHDRSHMVEDPQYAHMMKVGLSREEQLTQNDIPDYMPMIGPYSEFRPGGLYETMLKKIVPYAIRGVLWYQGESDDKHPTVYATVLRNMIENWRKLWAEELPFHMVQLAPFEAWGNESGKAYPILRQQQEIVSRTVDYTWLISSSDCGMQWDIHPKKKKPIGDRLAMSVYKHEYGGNISADAPELESLYRSGNDIILEFANAEQLHLNGEGIHDLDLLSNEGEIVPIGAFEIDQNKIILRNCRSIMRVSLAEKQYYSVNLYNEAGIPAKPFSRII